MENEIKNQDFNQENQMLLGPFNYLMQVSGKEIRTQLSNAFNLWLKIPDEKLKIINELTRMLHNASLLIDDIEDNSELRRGIPVAHKIYGIPQTINTANYVYFLGLQKALLLQHPSVPAIFTEQLILLHKGQGQDIYWRDKCICPSEDQYINMVNLKTGGLFNLAIRLMQLFSDNQSDLKNLAEDLGLYFQIRDDYANLQSDEFTLNKGFAEDLTEGKFSFPIIHAIKNNPSDDIVINLVRQKSSEIHVKKYCIEHLEKLGSFKYTLNKLRDLETKIHSKIESLGGNELLTKLVNKLAEISRK